MLNNPLSKYYVIPSFITEQRCLEIIEKANKFGKWTSNRHKNYPTTDIPVDNIPDLNVDDELERIKDICKDKYQLEPESTITPFDIFVVKYDANGQSSLDLHRDSSILSFVLLLSDPAEFEGGGTFYENANETVKPERGGLAIHCGKVRHAGVTITSGIRYILIGFMDVKSVKIRKRHPLEAKLNNKTSDQRHLDFLWRHNNTLPIKVSVRIINLKKRPEKLKRCLETITRLDVPRNWILEVKPMVANEGDGATPYPHWKTEEKAPRPDIEKFWKRDVKKGEIGCFVSHLTTIQSSDADYLLILEDDANMLSDFLYRMDQCLQELKEVQWDCLDFGGLSMDNKKKIITKSVVQCGYVYQTHCILYNKSGIAKIKEIDYTKNVIPYDECLLAFRKNHPRSKLNTLYPLSSPINCYHTYEQLSWQHSNGIHDTEVDTSQSISIPTYSRIADPYDMKNYYKFTNNSNPDINKILSLTVKANNAMWHFQIAEIQDIGKHTYTNWEMVINDKTKIVIIVNPTSMSLFRGTTTDLDCSEPTIFLIPSYMLFKCDNARIYYANGDSLI